MALRVWDMWDNPHGRQLMWQRCCNGSMPPAIFGRRAEQHDREQDPAADPDQHLQDYQAAKPAMDAEDRCG
jgi:hypothetical protein